MKRSCSSTIPWRALDLIRRVLLLIVLTAGFSACLLSQQSFPERVDRAFGNDQVLVNGIQFSNQYIRIEGNPYWLDDRFRNGSVCIKGIWYESLRLRYNIYSGRLELQYLTPEGHLNQIMIVSEHLSGFILDGNEFRRMELGSDSPAFYQVISSQAWICYVEWAIEIYGDRTSQQVFEPPERTYWMGRGDPDSDPDTWISFHDWRSFLKAVPPSRKKEFKSLLKERKFLFEQGTNREMTALVADILRLLESGGEHDP